MNTNVIEHLTESLPVDPLVKIVKIEQVPTEPIVKGQKDLWIEARRLEAENRFNTHRGIGQMDILEAKKVSDSQIPVGRLTKVPHLSIPKSSMICEDLL